MHSAFRWFNHLDPDNCPFARRKQEPSSRCITKISEANASEMLVIHREKMCPLF